MPLLVIKLLCEDENSRYSHSESGFHAGAGVGYAYGSGYMSHSEDVDEGIPVVESIGKVSSPTLGPLDGEVEEGVVPRIALPAGDNSVNNVDSRTSTTCGFF